MAAPGDMQETPVGEVTHYFNHLQVVAVNLTDTLHKGDKIHILGHATDLTCTVDSMQVDHQDVAEAYPGASVGIRVCGKVHEGAQVYRIVS